MFMKEKKQQYINVGKRMAKYRYYYLLLLPGLIYFLLFRYAPLGGLAIAFKDYRFVDGIWGSPWVGFKWFEKLFTAGEFSRVLRNTIIISLGKLVFGFPAPIILALMLNEVRHTFFKRTVQTIVYLPHFLSWVVLSGIITSILAPNTGVLELLNMPNPMTRGNMFRGFLVVTSIWKEVGWGTVVYLAAISGISQDLYEAARIDGAGRLKQIIYITVPAIKGTIAVLLIMRVGTILNAGFDQVYNLYSPLVYEVADVIDTYVYRIGVSNANFPLATAAGVFQSIVGFIMVMVVNYVTKKMGEDGLV